VHQEGSEPWGAVRGHGAAGSSPFLAVRLCFGTRGGDAALEVEAVLSWAQCLQVLQGITPWLAPLVQSWQRLQRGRSVVLGLSWICRDSRDAPCRPGGRILPGAEPHGDRGLCKFPHCHFALSLCAVRSCGDAPGQRTPSPYSAPLCPLLTPPAVEVMRSREGWGAAEGSLFPRAWQGNPQSTNPVPLAGPSLAAQRAGNAPALCPQPCQAGLRNPPEQHCGRQGGS